ncbi:hypothetical protein ACIO87_29305 [Streptomyces sp. NPDC087218]|uniref:nSTAND1 domain-containing NTPase n=1 Tax=Streptomyces sp. NPDC087218 TaxID=3365769 RepID=UPI0037FDAE1F
MGRRERPVDPMAGAVARFAYDLRKLRQEADGLTYRAMAARTHYSTATLAQAAAGERLPSLPVALAYAGACGGILAEWEERWREAEAGAAEEARAQDDFGDPPYRGLARFETADQERFFGRERLAIRLAELVADHRMVLLVGPSGSGKSSLLRAGLVPRLRRPGAGKQSPSAIRILAPGPRPAFTHAHLDGAPPGVLIIVDQFEEVFTLCTAPSERDRFVDLLLDTVRSEQGGRVVLAVRSDFYGHLAQYGPLSEAAQGATLLVGPMTPEELREAVVRPAALDGLIVERALTARVLREVADEPGGLPLMSHALLETWRRRKGRALTEAAYDAAGGIRGAVVRTAEELYEGLTPEQAATARRILLRLVTPGQGAQDTRRPAPRTELASLPGSELVLDRLARARLVTLDEDSADLSHEAVLTAWPRLRRWIDEDRDRLRAQRRLTEAALTWEALDRDDGSLYRGVRLASTEQQFSGHEDDLAPVEREFLTAGTAARHRERARRRTRTAVGSVLLVLSLVATLVAWQQNRSGEQRRVEAEARRAAAVADSLRLSDPATAMRLGLASWRAADLPETRSALLRAMTQQERDIFTDPDGSTDTMRRLSADGRTLISVGADQVSRWDIETRRRTAVAPGLGKNAPFVTFLRADAGWLPVFGPGHTVSPLDLKTGNRMGSALEATSAGAEQGASGRTLLVYGMTRSTSSVSLWDIHSRRRLLKIEQPANTGAGDMTSFPRARLMAVIQQHARDQRSNITMTGAPFPDATVSADDRFLALCVPGAPLQLWDVATRRPKTLARPPRGKPGQCWLEQIVFSPDGRLLMAIGDTSVRIWDTASGRELPRIEYTGLKLARFSADGAFMAGSDGEEVLMWRLSRPEFPVYRHRLAGEVVKDLRIDPGQGLIRYLGGPEGSWGPSVHTLDLGRATNPHWSEDQTLAAAYSPDGRILATAHQDGGHIRVRLLGGRTGRSSATLPRIPCPGPDALRITGNCDVTLAFDPTGRLMAIGVTQPDQHPIVQLYDLRRDRVDKVLGVKELGNTAWGGLLFLPDGRSLLVSDEPGRDSAATRSWDLRRGTMTTRPLGAEGRMTYSPDGKLLATSAGHAYRLPHGDLLPYTRNPGRATALAFSPGGEFLAVGEGSGRVTLWDGQLGRRLGVLAHQETSTRQYVSGLAFSPDGGVLAVAGDEGMLELWDTASHQRLGSPLPTSGDTIRDLVFDRDGTTLRTAGDHTAPQTYNLAPRRSAETICRRVTRGLSREEWQEYLPDVPYTESCGTH